MQKIRVTKTGKTGDQRDFSLVQKQVHYIGEGDKSTPVKNTMGAVPREEANIEVEGGETVIGDINQDGFLEHMTFVGKRHSQGGMPVNIPDGSFIFSDTKKLKIKDKEVLKNIFGLSDKKGGYTPAEIAKRYQINNYIQDLKSEDTDAITKRSATEMLKNNMEKLGQLALIQESMKGFPDGVPAIAESVMAGMQGSAEEQPMQEARMGGMKTYQQAGLVNGRPTPGYTVYKGNTPIKVKSADVASTLEFPYRKDYIVLENGERLTQKEFTQLTSGTPVTRISGRSTDNLFSKSSTESYSAKPLVKSRVIQDGDGMNTNLKISTGDMLKYKGQNYKVVDPFGESSRDYLGSWKNVRDKLDDTKGIITVQDMKGNITHIEGEDLGDLYGIAPDQIAITPGVFISNSNRNNQKAAKPVTKNNTSTNGALEQEGLFQELNKPSNNQAAPAVQPANNNLKRTNTTPTKSVEKKAAGPKDYNDMLNYFRDGGSLDTYQDAGEKSKEVPAGTLKDANGKTGYLFYTDTEKIVKDDQGNVVARAPFTAGGFRPHPGDKIASKNPVTGKVEQGWNKSKYTAEHIDQLARARGYEGPKDNKVLQQWIINHPEFSKVVNQLHDKYKMPYAGKEVDGYWGVRWDDALNAIPEKPKEAEKPAVSEKEVQEQPSAPKQPRKQGPWWLQDIVNFTGAMTDENNRYEPSMANFDFVTPGYVTEDPTRRLAANQEQMSKIQAQTENTVDGNVGLASMLGASGQGFANAANVLGEVENRNVGIVNNAYMNNATLENKEIEANEMGRQKYVEDMAVLNQQYDNTKQLNKWRKIAAFNNGVTNHMRKKQMDQVLFPQVYTDPITGDVDFSGQGRAYDEPDTYSPAYAAPGAVGFSFDEGLQKYDEIYKSALKVMPEKEARAYAQAAALGASKGNKAVTGPTERQMYNNMVAQGLTTPAPMQIKEYGGAYTLPWEDID